MKVIDNILKVEIFKKKLDERLGRVTSEHLHSHDPVMTMRLTLDWVDRVTGSYSANCNV